MKELYKEFPGLRGPIDPMAGRIPVKLYDAIELYCERHGVTKTQAMIRGFTLLLKENQND